MSRRTSRAANFRGVTNQARAAPGNLAAAIGLALILLTALCVYWPALNGARLWDDDAHITRPGLQSTTGLCRIWLQPGATQQYYPLLHTAFWIEHKLWGDAVLGYHLVNLFWHLLAVVFIFLILKRLRIPGALLAAAIFALHPVMVESVAWISEQKNTLSAFFYLSAMLAYLSWDAERTGLLNTGTDDSPPGKFAGPSYRAKYFLALALFILGLLTKTVTATLPVALLILFWWQRGVLSFRGDFHPLIPFFALGAAGGLTTAWVERKLIGAEGIDFQLSLFDRILVAGRVVWFYLAKLIWPTNLSFIYPRWTIDPATWWQWIFPIAVYAVTIALWSLRQRTRAPLAGWLFFVVTLFPVLGFLNVFPFIFSFVADHFQYLASLGVIVPFAAAISIAAARVAPGARRAIHLLCLVMLIAFAVLSFNQSHIYVDKFALYRATLEQNPSCWMAHLNLGEIVAATDHNAAIAHYEAALRLRPEYPEALNNLGFELTQVGRPSEAIAPIEKALLLRPDFTDANLNLGIALHHAGRYDAAIAVLRKFLQARPDHAEARSNLAEVLIQAGRVDEGAAEFRAALAARPDSPILLNKFGVALLRAGRAPEAIELLNEAVQLNPAYFQAHNSLGLSLASVGQITEGTKHFRRALELNPNYANAHANLADALLQQGDARGAISHYRRAAQLRPDSAEDQFKLALALTQSGQPEPALEHYQAAIHLNPNDLRAYASLAQTLVIIGRSGDAIRIAHQGAALARAANKSDELQQFENWLQQYRVSQKPAASKAVQQPPPTTE